MTPILAVIGYFAIGAFVREWADERDFEHVDLLIWAWPLFVAIWAGVELQGAYRDWREGKRKG